MEGVPIEQDDSISINSNLIDNDINNNDNNNNNNDTDTNTFNELEREESKSPIQEEEEQIIEVEIKAGLEELDAALKTGQIKEIRSCYEKLIKTFPAAVKNKLKKEIWAQYEYINGSYEELEGLFTKCLKTNLSVPLWKLYLFYVKTHQLPNFSDESEGRQTMLKAYDFAVCHIGLDVAAGPIWSEYLEFTQSNYYKLLNEKILTWEQQQLMDLTRKIYHRALLNPMEGLENLWHSYDAYENSLNKLLAKKLVSEKSSSYMAARSATRELLEIVNEINLNEFPLEFEDSENFYSWMKWINWEKNNPLISNNKPLIHSRIVYAFRRALMSMKKDERMWLAYSNYLRFDVGKFDDAELVLKQARRCCPLSLLIVLAIVDLKESRGVDLETIKPTLDQFISSSEIKLNQLKVEIIEKGRNLGNFIANDNAHNNDNDYVIQSKLKDDDDMIFENSLISSDENVQVKEYLKIQKGFNGAQVKLLEVSRRLSGLTAARLVFATARKSLHASPEIFSAAANLEFRIRKDPAIAAKIYELGLNRFPTNWTFSREYLSFLLAQNDDGNVRALFERIISAVEGFKSTHSGKELMEFNEISNLEIIKGIWTDFYGFEKEIGDYQSVQKFEERMRAAFPEEPALKAENLFMSRLSFQSEDQKNESLDHENAAQKFLLPRVKRTLTGNDSSLFCLSEQLFGLLLKLKEINSGDGGAYNGPIIDTNRFISFIERVSLPTNEKPTDKEVFRVLGGITRPTPTSSGSGLSRPTQSRRKRDQDSTNDDDHKKERPKMKQSKVASSIFEDRRRY